METWINHLTKASLTGSALSVILLIALWVWRKQLPALWVHLIMLIAVVRFVMVFPLPSAPTSWEHLIAGDSQTKITTPVAPLSEQQSIPNNATKPTHNASKTTSIPSDTAVSTAGERVSSLTSAPTSPPASLEIVVPTSQTTSTAQKLTGAQILFIIWSIGAGIMLLLLFRSILHSYKILKVAKEPSPDSSVHALLKQALKQAGRNRAPRLLYCNTIESPALCGIFRPTILIP